jgi:hypothetical protein
MTFNSGRWGGQGPGFAGPSTSHRPVRGGSIRLLLIHL